MDRNVGASVGVGFQGMSHNGVVACIWIGLRVPTAGVTLSTPWIANQTEASSFIVAQEENQIVGNGVQA